MFDFAANNVALPDFLDPLLSYLADNLPTPLYSFVINVISHSLTLFTALFRLVTSLLGSDPSQWDAQTVLPPLITILAAYLALLSLYRTTSWMIRTSIWFMKWGSILGALAAGVGYFMGYSATGNGVGGFGLVSTLGGFVLDMINGQGQNAAGGSRAQSKTQASRSRAKQSRMKPNARDSFERHREWQQQQNDAGAAGVGEVQGILEGIVSAAGRVMKDSGWWDVAKSFVEGGPSEDRGSEGGARGHNQKQLPKKGKAKAKNSRSR